ncbi:hypothetical protein HID58_013681 [Brassica napus]|uniref:Uncharacterized protein n=1 Tax=Brassica napus TaxID=3708 RepID=A0ABQ8E4N9_BRANA|nr:hypothetical protein HID58_013681 [Brassica napus]
MGELHLRKAEKKERLRVPTVEFQLELARMQAEGTEVIMEAIDEERGLLTVQGMIEAQDDLAEDIGMEMEALNATMLEEGRQGVWTLSEEEAEKAAEALTEHAHIQEEEDQVIGDVNFNKESTVGNMVARQGHRKRLFKPTISTAGSNKMRMASALFFPRKKVGAKVGTRNGDGNKPPKNKGPSNPKQGMGECPEFDILMVARPNKEIEDERRMVECRQCKWDSVLWDNMVFIVLLQ